MRVPQKMLPSENKYAFTFYTQRSATSIKLTLSLYVSAVSNVFSRVCFRESVSLSHALVLIFNYKLNSTGSFCCLQRNQTVFKKY